MDDYKFNKSTSRFCLLDEKEIVAGGIVDLRNYPDQREYKDNLKQNIIPENYAVSEIDRSIKFNHRPGIIWLTGLSGSGKSTIAKNVEKRLFQKNGSITWCQGKELSQNL